MLQLDAHLFREGPTLRPMVYTALAVVSSLSALAAYGDESAAHQALAFDVFKELIETNTTHSTGDTALAAQKMADRLLAAGYPKEDVHVLVNAPRKGNLVARLRSPEPVRGPIVLLAHLDVVEANPEDWSIDPFTLLERDGYYYGRGTLDDKDEAAIYVANMIRMKREGYVPNRDIILALTADEEGGPDNGVKFLLAHHRDLVDADFVLNEGGGGVMLDGVRVSNNVQAAEKVYQSYRLEITDSGGHSSRPKAFNPIYELAGALTRIAAYEFPVSLNETTRAFFMESMPGWPPAQTQAAKGLLMEPPLQTSIAYFASTPAFNALIRTTCVATQLEAGHAENALPQRADATINCRILPGVPPGTVKQKLIELIANDKIAVTEVEPATPSDPSPLTREVMDPIRDITSAMWPGVHVVPAMSTGATDGLFFRNAGIPVYGVSGVFSDANDSRTHGRDERILKQSFYDGLEFLDRLVRTLSSPADAMPAGPKL
ncbi:MAG: M20/M25/M40 family metallo-hydrolase [Pseudomonadales bacterium]|nr:M20/M25/M40 family metallo-hydrolase [Pseudomonadales bacterium]